MLDVRLFQASLTALQLRSVEWKPMAKRLQLDYAQLPIRLYLGRVRYSLLSLVCLSRPASANTIRADASVR
jgi:hypothetical protein